LEKCKNNIARTIVARKQGKTPNAAIFVRLQIAPLEGKHSVAARRNLIDQ
jgi:hypothetical protein